MKLVEDFCCYLCTNLAFSTTINSCQIKEVIGKMCIRDSSISLSLFISCTFRSGASIRNSTPQSGVTFASWWETTKAVSYTHLDVYKRQVLDKCHFVYKCQNIRTEEECQRPDGEYQNSLFRQVCLNEP